MRKKVVMVAIAVLCISTVGYLIRVATVRVYHNDACLVIGMLVADRIEKGESVADADVKPEIANLIRASVIHGRVKKDGAPTDLNGNAFLIQQSAGRVIVSTRFSVLQPTRSRAEVEIKAHNQALHRTAAKRLSFDDTGCLGAAFAGSARFRRQSVS
jgi:hypothetical protein